MIEVMFAIRKDGFKDHPIVPEGLDLVEEEDQFTHMLPLEDDYNQEDILSKWKTQSTAGRTSQSQRSYSLLLGPDQTTAAQSVRPN